MKIKAEKDTSYGTGAWSIHYKAGQTYDVTREIGNVLIKRGHAVEIKPKKNTDADSEG